MDQLVQPDTQAPQNLEGEAASVVTALLLHTNGHFKYTAPADPVTLPTGKFQFEGSANLKITALPND
jgi:hypothetical protein